MYTGQLLLSKRLFLEGRQVFERGDPVSCGIAVSLLQDSVEMLVWTLIKKANITPKNDKVGFLDNISSLQTANVILTGVAAVLDLNKARINFKHNGNLPAPTDRAKFEAAAESLLRAGMRDHFAVNFDDLTFVDQVVYADVRAFLKASLARTASGEFLEAMREAAKAHFVLLKRLHALAPRPPDNIGSLVTSDADTSGPHFLGHNLRAYFDELGQAHLSSMLRTPLKDVLLLRTALPGVFQADSGEIWPGQWGYRCHAPTDAKSCTSVVEAIVSMAMRAHALTGINV